MFARIVCCMSLGCLVPLLAQARDIDLKDTSVARRLLKAMPDLGGDVHYELKSLKVNPDGLSLSGSISVTASHNWGSWYNPVTFQREPIEASKTIDFDFNYDLRANKLTGTADLGTVTLLPSVLDYDAVKYDVKIDIDQIEGLLEEDVNTWLELIPNPVPNVLRRDFEDDYQTTVDAKIQIHGDQNVWFPSKEFVDWASPDKTVGTWLVEAVITEGASLKKAMKEVYEKAAQEGNRFINWLGAHGVDSATDVATKMLSGKQVEGFPSLTLRWNPIEYRSRVVVLGSPTTPWAKIMHPAFYVVYVGPGGSTNISTDPIYQPDINPPNVRKWKLGARFASEPAGARLVSITPNGAAMRAGLRQDEFIVAVDGKQVGMVNGQEITLESVFAGSLSGKVTLTVRDPSLALPPRQVAVQLDRK